MKRQIAVLATVALLAGGAACSKKSLEAGEARLVAAGHVEVQDDDGKLHRVAKEARIRHGDAVHVLTGTATVTTVDGVRYQVRAGEFLFAETPTLVKGEVLVESGRRAATVEAAGSEAVVRGVARLERTLAVSTAVYQGQAELRSGGRPFMVAALRQAAIPAIGVLPTAATPLTYDDRDEWDRRFLGAAMAFGRELEARSRAFGPNVAPGEGRTPGFYRLLIPELEEERQFDGTLLDGARSPGETLVGATLAVSGKKASFAERWRGIFRFRDEGAAWGLVALDQAVNDVPDVVRRLDTAIGRAPLGFSPGGVAIGPDGGAGGSGGSGADGGDDGDGGELPRGGGGGGGGRTTTTTRPTTTTTTPDPGSTTTTTRPSGPVPTPPPTGTPVDEVSDPLVTPVVDTLNGLLTPQP